MRVLACLLVFAALGCTTSFDVSSLRPRDAGGELASDATTVDIVDAPADVTDALADVDAADVFDVPALTDLPLATDATDGGACGGPSQPCCTHGPMACLPGTICNEGYCVACPGATVACSGVCVDPQTSLAHCGRCGNACSNGQSCVGGTCTLVCPMGLTACGDRCVSVSSNGSHCGRCDAACEAGQFCEGASCLVRCVLGQSVCANGCVDTATSVAHCGACGAACSREHAVPRCAAGACEIASCNAGFGDCDGLAGNGCETVLNTSANCGRCNAACVTPNATPACTNGACAVMRCEPGFSDCDMNAANGCETSTAGDVRNCGACGNVCSAGGVGEVAVCANSTCRFTSVMCPPGRADCGGVASDCETETLTSVDHCGRCSNACALPNAVNRCRAGVCEIAMCRPGFADCDMNPTNGCEADLRSTATSCGACGRTCMLDNATAQCSAGACVVQSCAQGFADCDQQPGNGCEVDVRTSSMNCGACGARCGAANGTALCGNGQCAIAFCAPGFADCDGSLFNGCEVQTAEDETNCGACRRACVLPNATAQCESGACRVQRCASNFADCDGNPGNGCEVDTRTSTQHCGACNRGCAVANGSGLCSAGACRVASCSAGFADCNSNPADGCETSTHSGANCGGCGVVCATGTLCSMGVCSAICSPGSEFCAGGCFVLSSDPRHCGACNRACPIVANSSPTCAGSTCGFACSQGYGDCDGNPTNGCETRLDSRSHCGACGRQCLGAANAEGFCSGGVCALSCAERYRDCDGNPTNGCEVDVFADPNNCGACMTRCGRFANSLPVCREGSCNYRCNTGWGNCDGNLGNGCEVDLFSSVSNCSSCGTTCAVGACRGGVCTACLTSLPNQTNCGGLVGVLRCDVDLSTSAAHCGGCAQPCPSGSRPNQHASYTGACAGLRCAMSCHEGWADCDDNWQNGCETNITCDRHHCGGCGNRGVTCAGGQVCCNGQCEAFGRNSCNLFAPGCR